MGHFYIFLSRDPLKVNLDKILLGSYSCVPNFQETWLNLTNFNLMQMKDMASEVRLQRCVHPNVQAVDNSGLDTRVHRYLACTSRNIKRRVALRPMVLRCTQNFRFMETMSAEFNLSLSYVLGKLLRPGGQDEFILDPIQVAALARLEIYNYRIWPDHLAFDHLLVQRLASTEGYKFQYCTRSFERESFNLIFWTTPFDIWTWTGLGISIFVLSVLVRGNWVEVAAIPMRQTCTILRKYQILILFMLVSIVITCAYESITSGFLTVPPPMVIMNSLKDLIDNDYKIIRVGSSGSRHPDLQKIFDLENITSHDFQGSVRRGTLTIRQDEARRLMLSCDNTLLFAFPYYQLSDGFPLHDDVKCYCAKETRFSKSSTYIFAGHYRFKFARAAQCLSESGILNMFRDLNLYMLVWRPRRRAEKLKSLEKEPMAFELLDWKVSSIFLIWAFLMCFSVIVLLTELLVCSHYFSCFNISCSYNICNSWVCINTYLWRLKKGNMYHAKILGWLPLRFKTNPEQKFLAY